MVEKQSRESDLYFSIVDVLLLSIEFSTNRIRHMHDTKSRARFQSMKMYTDADEEHLLRLLFSSFSLIN